MTTRTARTSRRRSERRPRHVVAAKAAVQAPAEQRTRHCGGPEDHAFYACTCGHAFSAGVTTSIACPRCGSGQAW
jgi:hypothetical protein